MVYRSETDIFRFSGSLVPQQISSQQSNCDDFLQFQCEQAEGNNILDFSLSPLPNYCGGCGELKLTQPHLENWGLFERAIQNNRTDLERSSGAEFDYVEVRRVYFIIEFRSERTVSAPVADPKLINGWSFDLE